ncbi:MAG: prepilin-type N-terminal cleavage/methylation domain-containing protein [Candidatus Omnitrophota bacterium]|jgi:prepilin-type N-terminal cleavage/methylation domain-containing protein|nr:MAG: prepilin-type N-terminal cleavage/methylation domain-containing protein [Candidatus Omnitrophota bacterium]
MILPIGVRIEAGNNGKGTFSSRGFTLIELIVVMALLSAVLAITAPSLSRFIHGRSLQEEARRMLNSIRYTQSQAVSLAVPMELRIDFKNTFYELGPMTGYEIESEPILVFEIDEDLKIEMLQQESSLFKNGIGYIRYWPDGSQDETSLITVRMGRNKEDDEEDSLFVTQKEFLVGYEILTEKEYEQREINSSFLRNRRLSGR